jgi:hypothetical protein
VRRLRNPTRLPAVVAIFLRRLRAHVHRLEPWFSLVKTRPHWRERAVIIITRVASCHSAPKMLCESATSTVDESSKGSNPPIDPDDFAATGRVDRREEGEDPAVPGDRPCVRLLVVQARPATIRRRRRPLLHKTPRVKQFQRSQGLRRRGCGGEHVEKAAGVLGRSVRRVGIHPAMRQGCKARPAVALGPGPGNPAGQSGACKPGTPRSLAMLCET